ncbi:MAG: hypothetical protein OHK93_006345 [Ramalina farinacea]|uniref:Uncharacterized protein n=1 Tax=Ramalina farinacea TaxID=258253 RepID=A0AA43TWN9_9LECA|nr:hypothetical protein [Ramalina farinacea]
MVKIAATRDLSVMLPQDVVKMNCEDRQEKLLAVGLSYDLAHAKGRAEESEKKRQERLRQERRDKRKKTAQRNFETRKRLNMKVKLRGARLQAIKDSKKSAQNDQNGKDKVDIIIEIGENTIRSSDQVAHEDGVFEHMVSGKKLKITVEATDEEGRNGNHQRGDSPETSANTDRRSSVQEPSSQPQEEDRQSNPVTKVSAGSEKVGPGQESPDSAQTTTPTHTPESSAGGELKTGGNTELNSSSDADQLAHKLASSKLSPPTPPPKPTFDDISDDGLSWSSDIDAPSDTDSEVDSEPEVTEEVVTYCKKCNTKVSEPIKEKVAQLEKNPWNAVCVIGLRVYSKEAQAEVDVIRKENDADSGKTEMLDMDDQAADATREFGKQIEEKEKESEDTRKAAKHEKESKQG